MKKKTLLLSHPHLHPDAQVGDKNAYAYRVEKIGETTEYNPHQLLKKNEVDQLCESSQWSVTIVPARS